MRAPHIVLMALVGVGVAASLAVIPRDRELALMYLKGLDYESAQSALEQRLNSGDLSVGVVIPLTRVYLEIGEFEEAVKLMERFAIKAKLWSYHEHNAQKVRPEILARLQQGATVALISDAGMPLVSDPGYRLVKEAVELGIPVTACPGPSAVLTGLALSGLPTDRFLFAGFVPQKQGERKKLFAEFAKLKATLIFFESPHRIIETLHDLATALPGRHVAVTRELTKLHEEVLRGAAAEIATQLEARPSVKGEITLLVGPPAGEEEVSETELENAITHALAEMPASKAASELAKRFNLNRSDVYQRILSRREGDGE